MVRGEGRTSQYVGSGRAPRYQLVQCTHFTKKKQAQLQKVTSSLVTELGLEPSLPNIFTGDWDTVLSSR